MPEIVTEDGKLHGELLPAIYLDSSVLIDYWLAEGSEVEPGEVERLLAKNEPPGFDTIRTLLKVDKTAATMTAIRRRIIMEPEPVALTPVTCPLAVLELIEWHAAAAFRQTAAEAAGVISVERRSRKNIGELLRDAVTLNKGVKHEPGTARFTSGPEWLGKRDLSLA